MGLVADYASLRAVLRYGDLPAAGVSVGDRIIVAAIGKVARWDGSAWALSPVNQSAVVAYTAGTNLVGVDGAGSNAAPLAGTETRLDAIDVALAAIIAALQAAGLMA